MERLWDYRGPLDLPIGLSFAGVAVTRIDATQNHVGVFHRRERGPAELLHLAWHADLRNDPLRVLSVVTYPDIPRSRARSVAAMCRLVWARHGESGLPYGLRYRWGRFDAATADLLLDNDSSGLTCATFVLAIYASCGLRLLDCGRWPVRDEDRAWHTKIIAMLEQHHVEQEHLDAIRVESGCARFRPEEVGAACLADELPASFERVQQAVDRLRERLAAY